jgi:hypothetical protein
MKLFIKVENGLTVEHPATEENLLQVFPDGIPAEFEPFERIPNNLDSTLFQKTICTYIKNENGVWNDSWSIVDMTDQEKEIKTQQLKNSVQNELDIRISRGYAIMSVLIAASDLNGVNTWNVFIDRCKNYVLETVDPLFPALPKFPVKDGLGNWVILY